MITKDGRELGHYCVADLLLCNSLSTNIPSEIYKTFQTNAPSQEARKIKPPNSSFPRGQPGTKATWMTTKEMVIQSHVWRLK